MIETFGKLMVNKGTPKPYFTDHNVVVRETDVNLFAAPIAAPIDLNLGLHVD